MLGKSKVLKKMCLMLPYRLLKDSTHFLHRIFSSHPRSYFYRFAPSTLHLLVAPTLISLYGKSSATVSCNFYQEPEHAKTYIAAQILHCVCSRYGIIFLKALQAHDFRTDYSRMSFLVFKNTAVNGFISFIIKNTVSTFDCLTYWIVFSPYLLE